MTFADLLNCRICRLWYLREHEGPDGLCKHGLLAGSDRIGGGDIGGPAKGNSSSNCAIPGVTSVDVVC